MCIVVYKPHGVNLPKKAILQRCFHNNADGAGLMFYDKDGKVVIDKGYMGFEDFWHAYQGYNFSNNSEFVLHFRIATAGSVCAENCHHFPLSDKVEDLQSEQFVTDMAMAHNGMIDYECETTEDLSDTMVFVKDVLSNPLIRDNLNNPAVTALLERSIEFSKIIIFAPGKIYMYGTWQKSKGIYYSNNTYLANNNSYVVRRKWNWRKTGNSYTYTMDIDHGYSRDDYTYSEYFCPLCYGEGIPIGEDVLECSVCKTMYSTDHEVLWEGDSTKLLEYEGYRNNTTNQPDNQEDDFNF